MATKTRVAIADDDDLVRQFLCVSLDKLGHEVVVNALVAPTLISGCKLHKPDLIITDIEMPGLDGLTALEESEVSAVAPVIVLSSYHDQDHVDRVTHSGAMAFLVKPIELEDLRAAIPLALKRFGEMQTYKSDASTLRQDLADRKQIERAKGVLMSKLALDEPTAFRHLQKLARDKRKPLVEIANSILLAEEVLSG